MLACSISRFLEGFGGVLGNFGGFLGFFDDFWGVFKGVFKKKQKFRTILLKPILHVLLDQYHYTAEYIPN
jgi:hypothetical protein